MKKLLAFSTLLLSSFVYGQQVCPKGYAVKSLEAKYSNVRQTALLYQQAGMGREYQAELQKLQTIVDQLPFTYLEQEISSFQLTREPQCMAAVYSQITGQKVVFQARSDGRWDVLITSQLVLESLSDQQLLSFVKRAR